VKDRAKNGHKGSNTGLTVKGRKYRRKQTTGRKRGQKDRVVGFAAPWGRALFGHEKKGARTKRGLRTRVTKRANKRKSEEKIREGPQKIATLTTVRGKRKKKTMDKLRRGETTPEEGVLGKKGKNNIVKQH